MNRQEKEQFVAELRERLQRAKVTLLTNPIGLKVEEVNQLRSQLRERGVDLRVVKNTLAKLAAKGISQEQLAPLLVGPNALVLGYDDPVEPAKIIVGFAKDFPKFEIKAGLLEGRMLSARDIEELAKLPGREVLLAQLVRTLNAPVSGLVNVLAGVLRQLVTVLDALRQKREAA